jgi:hypothetical protein
MIKNLLILGVGAAEYDETRDISFAPNTGNPNFGVFLLAARRQSDHLWVAVRIITQAGCLDKLIRGKPRGQILGLQLASGEPLYVGWPADSTDNRPRVYQGEDGAGKPYDAIDHKRLQWVDGEPFYPASEAGKEFVVHGAREGKHYDTIDYEELRWVDGKLFYPASEAGKEFVVQDVQEGEHFDEIERPICFVGNQPCYRARLGVQRHLVWGEWKSSPCDSISPPQFNGQEIVAWATDGSKIKWLSPTAK